MLLKNFRFTYKNVLLRNLLKKKYFSFFRKIFGLIFKFIIKNFKYKFSSSITDLDNEKNNKLSNYNLDDLFIKFNSDKGSKCIWDKKIVISHNYSIYYEKYFSNFKYKKINILELGSHEGRGLAGFYYYFPNSKITGANINPFQMKSKSKRIEELFVDVSSKKILRNLASYIEGDLDIIIDDASHNLRDIIVSFSILFKKLKKGGTYVIEDIDQFKIFKELNPYEKQELTPLQILLKIRKKENFNSSFISETDKKYLIQNIKKINIEKGTMIMNNLNISDIAFIQKK